MKIVLPEPRGLPSNRGWFLLVWPVSILTVLGSLMFPFSPASAATPACGPLLDGAHQVSTADQLKAVARGGDDTGDCGRRALYLQTQTIHLTGLWVPIPFSFRGTYDGGGHHISGLTVALPEVGLGASNAGMFSVLGNAGQLRNVHLMGASVTGNRNTVGMFAGYMDFGSRIVASSASGTVVGVSPIQWAGGFTGYNLGTIQTSYSSASVSGTERVGGIAGENVFVIRDSYSTGTVTGTNFVGGIVGDNSQDIFNSYSTGAVSGTSSVGGLVGRDTSLVENSFFDSHTSGQNDTGKGVGKSTAEMTDIRTFSSPPVAWAIVQGWVPFEMPLRIWGICSNFNSGYPFLLWQASSNPCESAPSTDSVAPPPAIHLDLKAEVGNRVAGAPVLLEGQGLKPGSPYSITVKSHPTILLAQAVRDSGRFSHTVSMPAGIAPGVHTITLSAVSSDGQLLVLSQAFTVGSSGEFVALGLVSSRIPRELAPTGADSSLIVGIGLLALGFLVSGVALILATQRPVRETGTPGS